MSTESNIATSTTGLIKRMDMNTKHETHDYDAWVEELIVDSVAVTPKRILDVGCGVGKQTRILTKLYPDAQIFSVDLSQSSLDTLKERHGTPNISTICADIDDVQKYQEGPFDLIVSSYAIYYSQQLTELLTNYIQNLLSSTGSMLLLGYGEKSNHELIDLINEIQPNSTSYYENFLKADQLNALSQYASIKQATLDNKVSFKSVEDFHSWFDSSELSKSRNINQVLEKVGTIIDEKGEFFLTKQTIGFVFKINSST